MYCTGHAARVWFFGFNRGKILSNRLWKMYRKLYYCFGFIFLLLSLHVSNVNKLSWVKFDLYRNIAGWNILWIAECKYFALLIRFAPMSSRCCSMTEANFRLAVVFASRIQDPECSHAYSVWLLISNAVYSNCRWRQPHQTLCSHLQSVWTKRKHRHDPLIY